MVIIRIYACSEPFSEQTGQDLVEIIGIYACSVSFLSEPCHALIELLGIYACSEHVSVNHFGSIWLLGYLLSNPFVEQAIVMTMERFIQAVVRVLQMLKQIANVLARIHKVVIMRADLNDLSEDNYCCILVTDLKNEWPVLQDPNLGRELQGKLLYSYYRSRKRIGLDVSEDLVTLLCCHVKLALTMSMGDAMEADDILGDDVLRQHLIARKLSILNDTAEWSDIRQISEVSELRGHIVAVEMRLRLARVSFGPVQGSAGFISLV